jgi:aminopeptidase N
MRTRSVVLVAAVLLSVLPASAQRLPTIVTPEHYDLAFAVDLMRERFEGTETIRVRVGEPTTRIVLNATELQFQDVSIGAGTTAQKATVTLDDQNQTATFSVPRPIPRGAAEIHVRFSGTLNRQLRGFYVSEANGRKYAVTQFESTDARRAFPCFDEPAFKSTFALTMTVDRGDTAISNGKVLSDMAGPGITHHTIKFATSPKMSSYLVAIAVGDFKCLDGSAENVPIRICATPDKKDLGRIALDFAEQILTFYNRYYAIKYPFGKLDVVAVPDFAAGAMENTAAIFYRETDLLADSKSASVSTRKNIASVLAHEMAHQWFGDLVTMQWWDDLWLNEGFATWMANKPLASAHPDWNVAVDEALENQKALNIDSLKTTRPIHVDVRTPEEIEELFDAITYEKGASVMRMVESYVGAETFRKGVNAYVQAHAYGNATSEDFSKALSATSGKPVERILPTFVNQPGFPLIDVSVSCANNRTNVMLKQQRFLLGSGGSGGSGEWDNIRWQVPVCLKTSQRQTATCEVLSGVTQTFTLEGSGCAAWVFANAGAQGYYRTAYSSDMLRAIAPRAATELTPPERLALIDDEWALVHAGRHSAADYLTLAAAYGREHARGVLADVTNRLDFIEEYLTTEATRPRFTAFVRTLLRPLVEEIGFDAAASESDDRRVLRATVVDALGTIAEDADVIARARAAVDRALAGAASLDPTLADAVVRTAAAHGDAALFDALVAASERAASPESQYRYLNALPEFRDPALIDRALQRALSSHIRSQDTSLYLSAFFNNPAARDRAWTFVTGHWAALEPKIMIAGGDTRLVASLGAFCDAQARGQIAGFFAAHKLPAAVRTLDQTLERIDRCVDLRATQTPEVAAWLAAQ